MSGIAAAIIGAGALTAGAGIYGATTAAKAQENAAQTATGAQLSMFNTANANLQPFIQGGESALPTLQSLLTPGPNQNATLSQLPGFQFANNWGQQGVSNQGTVTGLGGNTLAAGAQFGTGLAEQSWGTLINQLQGLVGTGASAAGSLAGTATATGGQIGSNIIGAGNAAGGAATATGSAIGNVGNSITTAALLNKLTGQNGMYASSNSAPALFGGTAASPFGGGSAGAIY